MAVKYVKDFQFDKSFGYTGSSGSKSAQTEGDVRRTTNSKPVDDSTPTPAEAAAFLLLLLLLVLCSE